MSLFTEWALCVFLKSFFLISFFFPAFLLSLLRLLRSDRATQPLLDFAGGSPRQEFVFWGRNEGGCSLWLGDALAPNYSPKLEGRAAPSSPASPPRPLVSVCCRGPPVSSVPSPTAEPPPSDCFPFSPPLPVLSYVKFACRDDLVNLV